MAKNWYDDQRNHDDTIMRRGDDRARDYGRDSYRESYRAGDEDAHRNDREMAFGNFNQRPEPRSGMTRDEQRFYPRADLGERNDWRHWGDDRDVHRGSSPWDRQFTSSPPNAYESSRFNRNEFRDFGLGYGRHDNRNFETRAYENRGYESRPSYSGRGPKGYRRSDDRIREEVSEHLERDHYIDASEVEVDVKDGVVTLRGHIEDRRQKRMAEDAIEHLSGVKDVRNELTVDQSFFQRAKEALFGGSTESISDTSKGDLIPPTNPRH